MRTEEPKFVADVMLGRVARWLRILGYDTLYFSNAGDDELIYIALTQKRILLTRDTELAKNAGSCGYLVRANELWAQLREIKNHFGLHTKIRLVRCPICNGEIVPVPRDEVKNKVPTYTFLTHDQFWRCTNCGKIYWRGSHTKLAEKDIKQKINGSIK